MDYYLYKLKFDGAVHFGQSDSALSLYTAADHFRADTLFSALCHTALSLWGKKEIEELIRQADADELLLSDSMPWRAGQFYLPKPCMMGKTKQDDIPTEKRKKLKKLAWIPVSDIGTFEHSICGDKIYEPKEDAPFGMTIERTSAAVFEGADTRPYQVGAYRFYPDCGLYVLVGVKTKEQAKKMDTLFSALGVSGIGGKVSSGYGAFTVESFPMDNKSKDSQMKWLYQALNEKNAKHQLLLTTSLPADDELEEVLKNANYQLVRRAGFVQSDSFAKSPMKKQMQYFMAAGAMLEKPFRGALYEVAENGGHSVVRYAKPMMLGVAF